MSKFRLSILHNHEEMNDILCLDYSVHGAGEGVIRLAVVEGWIDASDVGEPEQMERVRELWFTAPFILGVTEVAQVSPDLVADTQELL